MDYIVYNDTPELVSRKEDLFELIRSEFLYPSDQIWEADKSDGRLRDVTEDIAREFFKKFADSYDEMKYVPEFVIKQVGEDEVEEYYQQSELAAKEWDDHVRSLADVRNYL